MRSAHCRSTRRWTLNGYTALIRSTSLTRSYARICIRGFCVLSVNEVVETWKVPSDADKCRSCSTPRIRRQKNDGDWSVLTILVSKRFDIVRAAFYRAVPNGTLLRLC